MSASRCASERGCAERQAPSLRSPGFLLIPWSLGFALGLLCLEYAHLPVLKHILGGIAAAAAGMLIATGTRLLLPHRHRPAAVLFAALAL